MQKTKILRIMRMTAFFLLVAALQVSASTHSQTITFSGKGDVLRKAFHAIEQQTGYVVFYSKHLLEKTHAIEVNVKNMPLREFLDAVLGNQPLKYVIENTSILISSKPVEYAGTMPAISLFMRIKGIVTDSVGSPLIGATVSIKGTKTSVATDAGGAFTINASAGDILVFSFIGYEKQEIKIGTETNLKIMLKHDNSKEMEDVAVVNTGYQKLSKRELASAVTQVKMKDIELESKFSVDQMLTGQVPGLQLLQTSGEPGAAPTIRIRGTSSIIGGSAPLWVLDEIILENPVNVDVSNLNSPDARYLIGNAIAGVNPRDIETITVLKDASATAIYGARAANGVIVITTKKGRIGKPQVSYSSSISMNQRIDYGQLNLMNAGERVRLSQQIVEDNIEYSRVPARLGYEGLYLDYLNKKIDYDQFAAGVKKMVDNNTDWYKILFRNSITNNHSVSMSGGADRTTYYASLGYTNAQGAAKGSDQKRYSGMLKVNSWLSDKVYAGLQINASTMQGTGFHRTINPNQYAYQTSRTIPAFNDDGSYYFYETQQKSQEFPVSVAPKEDMLYNIMNETKLTGKTSEVTSFTAQFNLEYKFHKNFRYRFFGGYDQSNSNELETAEERSNYVATIRRWNAGFLQPGTKEFNESVIPWGGILSNNDNRKKSYTMKNTIEYRKYFDGKHLLTVMGGQEIRSLHYNGLSATYYGWQPERGNTISPALTDAYKGILNSLRPIITNSITNTLSWIGTATYSYMDKFTFNANVRSDGSNNFGNNPKYRFLPIWSFAGKYTLSNERFMENISFFNYLAIRGSYGLQGNIAQGTSPDLVMRVGAKNETTGLNESFIKYLANPLLRWERTNSYNIGFEFALFKRPAGKKLDVISGTIDVYNKKGRDIIVSRRVSQVIGLDQVMINAGRVGNRGVEGVIQVVPYESKDFHITLRVIASKNKNVLIEANKDLNITNDDKISGNALVEGLPIGAFYSYRYAGLNPDYGFPMFYTNKGEKRYELYPAEIDLVYSGVRTPDWSGGLDLGLRYKNFYANFGLQYAVGGVDRLPNFYRMGYYDVFDPLTNVTKEFNNRWRKPGDEQYTDIPVLYDNENYKQANEALQLNIPLGAGSSKVPLQMYDQSDLRTAKTSNIRLRNINLNYVLNERHLKNSFISSLTINFQTENLFLVADKAWQGRDPESGSSNTPLPKVYTLGINVGF